MGIVEQKSLVILDIERQNSFHPAMGFKYNLKFTNGSSIETDDEELLDKFLELRNQGGRVSIEKMKKILIGKVWNLDN